MGMSSVESGGGGIVVEVVAGGLSFAGVGVGGGARNMVANAEAQS